MIELKNICVSFNDIPVLRNLSATIEQGDFISIVGPNGCGKSTLFNVIAGKIKPQVGSIVIDGVDVIDLSETEGSAAIARLFQNPRLNVIDSLSLEENLALAALKSRRARLKRAIIPSSTQTIPELLGCSMGLHNNNFLKEPMATLSGGQRQIAALVMATQCAPKILLLDEPTAALDPVAATNLLRFTAHFVREHAITTLLVTHDPQIALHMGNKLWVLEDGQLARVFGQEKRQLSSHHLIGEIDYKQLCIERF